MLQLGLRGPAAGRRHAASAFEGPLRCHRSPAPWRRRVHWCYLPSAAPRVQPIIYPRNDLNYAENFLHMMFAGEGAGSEGSVGGGSSMRVGAVRERGVWCGEARAGCCASVDKVPQNLARRITATTGHWPPLITSLCPHNLLPLPLTTGLPLITSVWPPHIYAVPSERYEVDPELAKALEIIFILHLDHEQNASTSTVRTAGECGQALRGLAWAAARGWSC